MFRSTPLSSSLRIALAAAVTIGAAVLAGCSSGGGGDYSAPMPSGPSAVAKKPASGPAIVDKLKFEQLALDSPVKTINRGGVTYLEFKYTDLDGTVRTCELPRGRTNVALVPNDWISTFNVYKKAGTAVVRKREVKQTDQGVVDFPFIAPKPVKADPKNQSNQATPNYGGSSGPGGMPMPGR